MKIDWSELKYALKTKWSSFTYLYRRPYYKLRLIYRISKIDYYGTWEMVEPMLEIPFILFCEFYEQQNIKNHYVIDVEKESNEHGERAFAEYQNNCYKQMDELYQWITIDRHIKQEELDYLLHIWSEHHVMYFGKCTDDSLNEKGCVQYRSTNNKYADYLFKLMNTEEKKFEKEIEDNLIKLMKLRNRLWD